MKIIVILGKPGSGKGTQMRMLVKKFKLEFFGSGNALRKRQKVNDFTGKKLTEVMKKGELVPSFVVSKLWIDELESLSKIKKIKGFIIDGSPRKKMEASLFDEALDWYNWEKNLRVIFINISKKESFDRLAKRKQCESCGIIVPWSKAVKDIKKCSDCGSKLLVRADDNPEGIKRRLEKFKKEVLPVISHYRKNKKLIEINGEQSIDKVFKEILLKLKLK